MLLDPGTYYRLTDFKFRLEPHKDVVEFKGKIYIFHNDKEKLIKYRIILPQFYPKQAPWVFLDEPVNQNLVDLIDYLEPNNRI